MTGRPRMSAANEPSCVSGEPRRSSRIDRDGFIAPSQISHAVSFGMFLVHPCRDVAGFARTVGATIRSKDKGNRPLQHKQPRVKLVRVRSTMHVWFDLVLSGVFAFMIGLYRRMEPLLRCRSMDLGRSVRHLFGRAAAGHR
jgi:hypothetical protein